MVIERFLRLPSALSARGAVSGLALLALVPACGGAVASGVATGRIGQDVSAHAQAAPQGAEVCALKDALAAPAAGPDKPTSDTCSKAVKSDALWRRAMVVLGAYSETLDGLAAGAKAETTGPLEAALTGVRGSDWIEVEDGPEKAAREAVAQLVEQIKSNASQGDLEKVVKAAGPQVKVICDGLDPYLDTQARALADIQKEIEKRRTTRNDRRCGMLDTRSVCVSESVVDRVVYANAFGRLAALENSHLDARRAVAGFCAAHAKLVSAADKGELGDEKTYFEIVEAVKSVTRAQQEAAAEAAKAAPPKK